MKECALCAKNIDHVKEPALLFIGRYGRRYEICLDCEELMDTLVSPDFESERDAAVKKVYGYLFENGEERVSSEMVNFFKDLLSEDSELMSEAKENLEEYEAEEEKRRLEAEEAAKKALDGLSGVPEDIVWQAEFRQGTEVWWESTVDTGWYKSTTYFCRG